MFDKNNIRKVAVWQKQLVIVATTLFWIGGFCSCDGYSTKFAHLIQLPNS